VGKNNVSAIAPALDHGRDQRRRVLKVCIQNNHRLTSRKVEAAGHGGFLAKIPRQANRSNGVVTLMPALQRLKGQIRTTVINHNNFESGHWQISQHGFKRFTQGLQAVCFIEAGNHQA